MAVQPVTSMDPAHPDSAAADAALLDSSVAETIEVLSLLNAEPLRTQILAALDVLHTGVAAGGLVLFCGNGGSAADADHFAAEFIGRCVRESPALPAISLGVSPASVTAIANDYGYEEVFRRQVLGLASPGDVLVGLTTSGRSANVLAAFRAATQRGVRTIALTGAAGLAEPVAELEVRVPSTVTARIQEAHKLIGHVWATAVEARYSHDHGLPEG